MTTEELQEQCELGQWELVRTNYLVAERILADAERLAWERREFDTLSRLYMPLQEARRQRRQRCGEGVVCLDIWARSADDVIDANQIAEKYPFGQLLVAGWASIEPPRKVRQIQWHQNLYLETFLGAVYPTTEGSVIVIVPLEEARLPTAEVRSPPALASALPEHSLILRESELPRGLRQGTYQTYGQVMTLWERLHRPFLAAADAQSDPIKRIEAYRRTIEVDYACELAHQKLADVARALVRK
jgi:hypothetical protein